MGKSTLFNRITGSRRAIVSPIAGTTRDALARPADWRGTAFELFDTGGCLAPATIPLHELVVVQGTRAIEHADLLVLVVDGREGLVPADQEIAQRVARNRASGAGARSTRPTTNGRSNRRSNSFSWGSSRSSRSPPSTGHGVAELLDEIVKWAKG